MDDLGEPLGEEETRKVIDDLAEGIVKRGMEAPAILFLEMNKPLAGIAGQGLVVAMPFLGPIFGPAKMATYSRFLQTRENVERLIQRIEELADKK